MKCRTMAVVANFGSNHVTLIRVPFATPRLNDVQPKTGPPGGTEHEITVTGDGVRTDIGGEAERAAAADDVRQLDGVAGDIVRGIAGAVAAGEFDIGRRGAAGAF